MLSNSMNRQLFSIGKSLQACLTLQMINSLVNPLLMLESMGVLLETCLAEAAVKGARLNVNLFVPCQNIEEWEGFSADVTLVIPCSSVSHHVFLNVRWGCKRLSTDFTLCCVSSLLKFTLF